MTTPALMPCPFCGGEATMKDRRQYENTADKRGVYRAKMVEVFCMNPECGASLKGAKLSEKTIITAWNTRPTPPPNGGVDEAVKLAQIFHETYERLAPQYGYETRKDSAVAWENVPAKNRALMIAVCAKIQAARSSKPSMVNVPYIDGEPSREWVEKTTDLPGLLSCLSAWRTDEATDKDLQETYDKFTAGGGTSPADPTSDKHFCKACDDYQREIAELVKRDKPECEAVTVEEVSHLVFCAMVHYWLCDANGGTEVDRKISTTVRDGFLRTYPNGLRIVKDKT